MTKKVLSHSETGCGEKRKGFSVMGVNGQKGQSTILKGLVFFLQTLPSSTQCEHKRERVHINLKLLTLALLSPHGDATTDDSNKGEIKYTCPVT